MNKFIFPFLLLFSMIMFGQSPWTQDKGDIFINFSFSTIGEQDRIFGNPEYNTERFITDQTYQLYAEYGLTDKTSLIFSLPLKSIETGNFSDSATTSNTNSGSKTSLGNISLGIKHQFYNKGWFLAGQLAAEINTSSFDATTGIRTDYDAFTFTPLFLAGKGFNKSFVQAHFGAQIRTHNYSSNFKIGGEYGYNAFKNVWLIGFVDIVKSFENGNVTLPDSNLATALYVNDQEYGAFGVKGIWQFCYLGFTAGFGGAFFGNNVAQAPAFSMGIFNTFQATLDTNFTDFHRFESENQRFLNLIFLIFLP